MHTKSVGTTSAHRFSRDGPFHDAHTIMLDSVKRFVKHNVGGRGPPYLRLLMTCIAKTAGTPISKDSDQAHEGEKEIPPRDGNIYCV